MGLLADLAAVAGGLALLIVAADRFVAEAGHVALAFRISPMAIGLTLVAFGTSLPELAVSLNAALAGSPGLALGNVVGSNLANTLLILGFCAILVAIPVTRESVFRDGTTWLVATAALWVFCASGGIGRVEGALLLVGLAGYLAIALWQGMDFSQEVDEAEHGASSRGLRTTALLALSGLAIWAGSEIAVIGAVGLAAAIGVSDTIIGLTVIAIGTSLPELATSYACVRKGQADMLIGGLVGSNIFNILAIIGVTATIAALPVGRDLLTFDLPVLMAISVLALLILRSGWVVSRREGALLLGAYGCYIGLLTL